jgi:hypothetical protein
MFLGTTNRMAPLKMTSYGRHIVFQVSRQQIWQIHLSNELLIFLQWYGNIFVDLFVHFIFRMGDSL